MDVRKTRHKQRWTYKTPKGKNNWTQGSLQPGILHQGVLTTRGLTTTGSYNQGSYNQLFLQPGVLTTRDSYIQGS